MKKRRYYSIRIDQTEARGRARAFFDIAKAVNAAKTREDESEGVYVMFDSKAERDAAIEAYDGFRSAVTCCGPFDMEEDDY